MSFFFPSFWDDQEDEFFEPYSTLSRFLGDLNAQRIEQQKAQQIRAQQQREAELRQAQQMRQAQQRKAQQHKVQQQKKAEEKPQRCCFQKNFVEEEDLPDDKVVLEDDEGAMSDGEVIEEHEKCQEEAEKEKEEEEEVCKAMKEAAERAKKEVVLVPAADVIDNGSEFVVVMNMPGIKKENIVVSLENDLLTVKAERPQPFADAKAVLRREIPCGTYERQFEVPKGTKPEGVHAKVEDGVLTVTIAKPVTVAPRKIEIA